MRIHHRLKSVDGLFATADKNSCFTASITQVAGHEDKLRQMGFSWPLELGESVLPPGHCGKACSRNANGWEEKHEDRALEIFHYQQLWKWKMKRGYSFEYGERIIEREQTRYPRTFHPPFSMEIQVQKRDDGAILLAMPGIRLSGGNKDALVNAINVLIEIFGSCFVLNEALTPITPVRSAHWRLVPRSRPWRIIAGLLGESFESLSAPRRESVRSRFEMIDELRPALCAVGQQGFSGHWLLGFPSHRLHLLDIFSRHSTTAISGDWSYVSELSLSDLLDLKKSAFSVSHTENWRTELLGKLQQFGVGV